MKAAQLQSPGPGSKNNHLNVGGIQLRPFQWLTLISDGVDLKPTNCPTLSLREGDVTNLDRLLLPQQHWSQWEFFHLLQSTLDLFYRKTLSGSQNLRPKESMLSLHLVTFSFDPLPDTKLLFPDSLYEKKTHLCCVWLASLMCLIIATEIAYAFIPYVSVWLCPLYVNLLIFSLQFPFLRERGKCNF